MMNTSTSTSTSANTTTIAVHDGIFHSDDVVAVSLIRHLTPSGVQVSVTRTRDPERLAKADIVVDVGGGELDHHGPARARAGHIPGTEIWHCGATLVAAKYAPELLDRERYPEVFAALLGVAAQDNGQEIPPGASKVFEFVRAFIPPWDETYDWATAESFDAAVETAQLVLRHLIDRDCAASRGRAVVHQAVAESLTAERPEVVILDYAGLPWQGILPATGAKFVVFPAPGEGNNWMCRAVPPAERSFAQKVPFPAAWAGKEEAALSAVSGIPGAVFCHSDRHISGWVSKESAIAAASAALEVAKTSAQQLMFEGFIVPNAPLAWADMPEYLRRKTRAENQVFGIQPTEGLYAQVWILSKELGIENATDHGLPTKVCNTLELDCSERNHYAPAWLPLEVFDGLKEGDTIQTVAPNGVRIGIKFSQSPYRYRAHGRLEEIVTALKNKGGIR